MQVWQFNCNCISRSDCSGRYLDTNNNMWFEQCKAINVGFELYIGIESKLSISMIGFDLELGEFCHDFHSISIPINHSGTHFNLPAISTSLK